MSPTCCVCCSPDLACARVLGKSELCVDSFMRLWRLPEVVCGCWCVVPMLDKVAKKKRILLGSISQEGEARLKLYLLLIHLLSIMVLMLPAVMAM